MKICPKYEKHFLLFWANRELKWDLKSTQKDLVGKQLII